MILQGILEKSDMHPSLPCSIDHNMAYLTSSPDLSNIFPLLLLFCLHHNWHKLAHQLTSFPIVPSTFSFSHSLLPINHWHQCMAHPTGLTIRARLYFLSSVTNILAFYPLFPSSSTNIIFMQKNHVLVHIWDQTIPGSSYRIGNTRKLTLKKAITSFVASFCGLSEL